MCSATSVTNIVKKFLTFSMITLFLIGCASTPISPEKVQNLKRIGIVTLLPSDMYFALIGTTVFNNQNTTEQVGSVFNDAAFKSVYDNLKSPDRTLIKIDADIESLHKKIRSAQILFDSPIEQIEKETLKMIADHQLDGVVFVIRNTDPQNGIYGISFFMRTAFGIRNPPTITAGVSTIVVDKKVKALSQKYSPLSVIAKRSNDQFWSYSLHTDLDPETKKLSIQTATHLVYATVQRQLGLMQFNKN